MTILGLLLVVAAAVLLVDMALTTHGTANVHVLGWHIEATSSGRLLLLAAAIGVVLASGLGAVLSGQGRQRRRRRTGDQTLAGARAENERLAVALEQERARAAEPDTEPAVVAEGRASSAPGTSTPIRPSGHRAAGTTSWARAIPRTPAPPVPHPHHRSLPLTVGADR